MDYRSTKIKTWRLRQLLSAVGLSVLLGLTAVSVSAQTMPTVTVAPAFSTAQIGRLQPQVTVAVGIKNNFDTSITMNAALSGLDIASNALRLTNQPDPKLAAATSIVPTNFTIAAGGSINVLVTIKNTPDLSPGGHYFSLLLTQTTGAAPDSRVAIEPAISATIFVVKEDGALRAISASQLHLNGNIFSWPSQATVVFKNQGNVYSVPRGLIAVYGSTQTYAQGIVNAASIPLFPAQTIRLQTSFTEYRLPKLPGHYSAKLQYRYDGQDSSQTLNTSFWYLPIPYLLVFPVGFGLYWLASPRRRLSLRQWTQPVEPAQPIIEQAARPVPTVAKTLGVADPQKTKIAVSCIPNAPEPQLVVVHTPAKKVVKAKAGKRALKISKKRTRKVTKKPK